MKASKFIYMGALVGFLTGTTFYIGGCSSVPKPVVPDGATRVAANDPARITEYQQKIQQDRQLMEENALLKKQLDELQGKVSELAIVLRQAMALPEPKKATPEEKKPTLVPQNFSNTPARGANLPSYAYMKTPVGTVVRVFHPYGVTQFRPNQDTQAVLKEYITKADSIEIRGYTDAKSYNPIDRYIATERAKQARAWLVAQGVDSSKIRILAFASGGNLTENRTSQGRSLNRRVEIDITVVEPDQMATRS